MRLIVTGTRHGRADLRAVLDAFVADHGEPDLVLVGDARGVDAQARAWAITRGLRHQVFLANWQAHGLRAGPLRNAAMVAAAEPGDWCLALPDARSRGTWDCVRRARARGLLVVVIEQ